MRLNILGGSYDDQNKAFSPQRSVNCYLQADESGNAYSNVVLRACYGVTEFSDLSTSYAGDIRCVHTHKGDGRLYVIVGAAFLYVASDGTATKLGTMLTSSGRCHIIDGGQTSADNQLMILDGTRTYTWNQATSTFTTISLTVLPKAVNGTYIDGYYVVNQELTSDTFEISALNDPTSWAGEQVREASEADPNVRLITSHGELWVFGAHTTKVWTNTGNIDFPFENLDGSLIERGLICEFAVVVEDNSIFWVGDDRIVYRANGYTPQRVSTFPIEQKLFKLSATSVCDVHLSSHTEDGAKMITLYHPTFCYQLNLATGMWHERQSFGASTWNYQWVAEAYGKVILGSTTSGKLGYLDATSFQEFGSTMQYYRITPPIHADQVPFIINRLEIVTEAGISELSGEGADAQIMTYISRDSGRSFGNPLVRNIGSRGDYDHRAVMRQLGQHYSPVFKFVVSDPVRRSILTVVADVEPLDI